MSTLFNNGKEIYCQQTAKDCLGDRDSFCLQTCLNKIDCTERSLLKVPYVLVLEYKIDHDTVYYLRWCLSDTRHSNQVFHKTVASVLPPSESQYFVVSTRLQVEGPLIDVYTTYITSCHCLSIEEVYTFGDFILFTCSVS